MRRHRSSRVSFRDVTRHLQDFTSRPLLHRQAAERRSRKRKPVYEAGACVQFLADAALAGWKVAICRSWDERLLQKNITLSKKLRLATWNGTDLRRCLFGTLVSFFTS
jgi:hypothetical protein